MPGHLGGGGGSAYRSTESAAGGKVYDDQAQLRREASTL